MKQICKIGLCIIMLAGYALRADQVWDGVSVPANVLDENLFIDGSLGTVLLANGQTTVQALTTSVNVTVGTNPIVSATAAGSSVLLLQAQSGNAINIYLNGANQDLTFQGPTSGSPLLIVADADGSSGSRINFFISDGNVLSFSPNGAGTIGVEFYNWMGNPAAEAPTVLFARNSNGNNSVTVNIGTHCVVSFLSSQDYSLTLNPTQQGRYLFNPQNTGTGRMVIDIKNKGAFIVEGHSTSGVVNSAALVYANINRALQAGLTAIAEVEGSGSNLLTINRNATSFDFASNPFNDQVSTPYTGLRFGFVLGGAGSLNINDGSYFDYVGLYQQSLMPTTTTVGGFPGVNPQTLLKGRNPSALFVDGISPTYAVNSTAQINFGNASGLYLRSGVDSLGNYNDNLSSPTVFTISPLNESTGAGEIVMDVEGPLLIQGTGITTSKLEVLSLQVTPSGGPLQPGGAETTFPLRTFAVDGSNNFLQYNKAAILVNNMFNVTNASLDHTDALHYILQKNDGVSEPTYVGGERWHIYNTIRPAIQLINSTINVYSDVAFTGVDVQVPNGVDTLGQSFNNNSSITCYYSGYVVADGTGRMMIFGTTPGSTAFDGCTVVSADAHLNVMQTTTAGGAIPTETLSLFVGTNTNQIDNRITGSITNQLGIHTLFLGHDSNITVGNQVLFSPGVQALSVLQVEGNFYSFETHGGEPGIPALTGVVGQGAIFVDNNGTMTIGPNFRASVDTMVVKSGTGIINLPSSQVFFGEGVGIADWQLDLAVTSTVVGLNTQLSDYSINWLAVKKDYAGGFIPYEIGSVNVAQSPSVIPANIFHIPTVLGQVDQLQIQGSRIGDQAQLLVDGGWVRELVFQAVGGYSAQAPVGLIVVENYGRVGIGTAERNVESVEASVVMGVNGVTIVANGDGQIDLNNDMLVNNVFSILKGPNFSGHTLRFNAEVERELRIKSTGILDLTQFSAGDTIQFTGNVSLVLEPGAQCITNGVTILFSDNTSMKTEAYQKSEDIFDVIPHDFVHDSTLNGLLATPAALAHNRFAPLIGTGGLANTDPFRVRFAGTGTYQFNDKSVFFVPQFSFVGVETIFDVRGTATVNIPLTDLTFFVEDDASFVIGNSRDLYTKGGSFQIGNTQDLSAFGHTVAMTLQLGSPNAIFSIDTEGFFGLNVGIVDKRKSDPNNWLVDELFNVSGITLTLGEGNFDHSRTFSGDDVQASLIAIGGTGSYTVTLANDTTLAASRLDHANITGGGNIVLVSPTGPGVAAYHPVVVDDSPLALINAQGTPSPLLQTGILASGPQLKLPAGVPITGLALFNLLRVQEITAPGSGQSLATAAYTADQLNTVERSLTTGFVNNKKIGRNIIFDISNASAGLEEDRLERAAQVGSVSVQLSDYTAAPGVVLFAQQLF